MSSKVYDVLKFIAQIGLPALGTLYVTLAALWHLPAVTEVSGTVIAVDTFLGVLLGLSTSAYNKSDDRFGGTLAVVDGEDGSTLRMLGVDPVQLTTAKQITFKIVSQ